MTMFLITTAVDLLFPATESHFMCVTKCMKSVHEIKTTAVDEKLCLHYHYTLKQIEESVHHCQKV